MPLKPKYTQPSTLALGPFLQATNAYIKIVENRLGQILTLTGSGIDVEEIEKALKALSTIKRTIEVSQPEESSKLFNKLVEIRSTQVTAGAVLPMHLSPKLFEEETRLYYVEPDLDKEKSDGKPEAVE